MGKTRLEQEYNRQETEHAELCAKEEWAAIALAGTDR
jgi:hypothetical protein